MVDTNLQSDEYVFVESSMAEHVHVKKLHLSASGLASKETCGVVHDFVTRI